MVQEVGWIVTGKLAYLTAVMTWGFASVGLSFPCAFRVRSPLTWTNTVCAERVSLWGPCIGRDTASRDLFAVISYGWVVSLYAAFVNSSEILKKEKQWMLSKRCLVSWWEFFDLRVSKQMLNNILYFLGPLSQIHETSLTKWRINDF